MEYNEVKQRLVECPDLPGLEDTSQAFLLRRGEEQLLKADEVIYTEGTKLDNTFCLLLSGIMFVEKRGTNIGEISEGHIFGEMAYFSSLHERTATVRAGSPKSSVLKIQLTLDELRSANFSLLKRYLGLQAWDRFVRTSQSCP
jgi:CRP-like cAMP-binding protein